MHIQAVSEITLILDRIEKGDAKAADELLPLVYDELRRLAAAKMRREVAGQTPKATALVHEAWMRLGGSNAPSFQNRAHFFGAASEAMRRILIESSSPVGDDDQLLAVKPSGQEREAELFAALEQAAAERWAFIDKGCGADQALRRRLKAYGPWLEIWVTRASIR